MGRSAHHGITDAGAARDPIIYASHIKGFEESLKFASNHWQRALIYLDRAEFRLSVHIDLDAALTDAELCLQNHEWHLSHQLKAKVLEALKRYDEARVAFDKSIDQARGNDFEHYPIMEKAKFFHRAGRNFHAEGCYTKAIEWFTLAIDVPAPPSAMYWVDRGNAKMALQRWEGALDDARHSLQITDTLYARILEARALCGWMQYRQEILPISQTQAEEWCSLIDPDDGLANLTCEDLCDLGRLAFGSAKEEKAEKLFGMAYQMNPDEDRLAWCALARGLRNVSPSMPDLGKSICNPASAFSYYVEGVLCLKSKRYEDAFLKFDEGLRMCSEKELWDSKGGSWGGDQKVLESSGPHFVVGCERKSDEHLHVAVDIYTRAISLSCHFWFSCKHLTIIERLWAKAIRNVEKHTKLAPGLKTYCTLAKLCRSVGQYGRALEAFEAAAGKVTNPQSCPDIKRCTIGHVVEFWLSKWQIALNMKDLTAERRYITMAIVFGPCDQDLYAKRSHIAFLQADWVTALHDVNQCTRLKPKSCRRFIRVKAPTAWQQQLFKLYNKGDYDQTLTFIAKKVEERLPIGHLDHSGSGSGDITTSPFEWEHPEEVARSILSEASRATNSMPLRLIHTPSGRLYPKNRVVSVFKKSNDYKRLLIFLATQPRMWEATRERVQEYFKYVMLSHRWDVPEYEPKLKDIDGEKINIFQLKQPLRMDKLKGFCLAARELGFNWTWSDTCCIDKDNPMEMQESIPSMVIWYQASALTIVHLSDVQRPLCGLVDGTEQFKSSQWFKRGWTLQELLASRRIIFYTSDWTVLVPDTENHKIIDPLPRLLAEATNIDLDALQTFERGWDNPRERLRWACHRETTREEDMAYSLMGIFSLQLPVLYAEGKERALGRLLEAIVGHTGDSSVLQWTGTSGVFNSCLPSDISAFREPALKQNVPSEEQIVLLTERFREREEMAELIQRHRKQFSRVQLAPAFQNSRLSLTCVVHDAELIEEKKKKKKKDVCRVDVSGFRRFEVVLSNPGLSFEELEDVVVIRPWSPEFHVGSKQRQSGRADEQVVRTLAGWVQPSYVLVLGRRKQENYRRIAGGVAEIEDISKVLETMRIDRLEIF